MSLMHAFSNEQEGLPISSWLKQVESDENMTEGDKSKNTQKTVKATSVKPGGVKDVKVKKYKKIPSNWSCDLARGKCIVKDNPANEKGVFKRVEDCIEKTECNGFIKKDAKGKPAKATRAKATRVKATRVNATRANATRVKATRVHLSPEQKSANLNKYKSKRKKSKKRKSKKRKSKK